MASRPCVCFLIIAYILIHVISFTTAEQVFLFNSCGDTGNYTANSVYQDNLNKVLSSISSETKITTGFYNFSSGRNSSKVNALALCRGDIDQDNCRTCLNASSHQIRQVCPNQKEAIVWYENCMLRYSNRSISHTPEIQPSWCLYNINNASDVVKFNNVVKTTLEKLREEAARGSSTRKFATGDMSGPLNSTIYGLVQCTPDLSERQCNECLNQTIEYLPSCSGGKIGGRLSTPSCSIRYETRLFYNGTMRHLTPPAGAPAPFDATPPADTPASIDGPSSADEPPSVSPPPRMSETPPPSVTTPQADAPTPPPPPSGKGGKQEVAIIPLSTITAAVAAIIVI